MNRRLLVLLFAGSFVLSAAFPLFRATHPARTVGGQATDHFSHWGSTLLFARYGLDIYRRPVRDLCPLPARQGPDVAEELWCEVPEWTGVRPFAVNWSQYPRVYPPGVLLLGAPSAALYALGGVEFGTVNAWLLVQWLFFAHLASLGFLLVFRTPHADPTDDGSEWRIVTLALLFPMIHVQLLHVTLMGMYDAVAVGGVVWATWFLSRGRSLAAGLALSGALFLHFRALWYLPLLGVVAWRLLQGGRGPGSRPAWLAGVGAMGLMLGGAAAAFLLVWPALGTFPVTNPLHPSVFADRPGEWVATFAVVAPVLVALALARSWLTFVSFTWQLVMLVATREVRPWHALFVLPLFAIAATERRRWVASFAVVAAFLWECRVAFSTSPFAPAFWTDLLGAFEG